jgi:hypothetical protein
MNVISLLTSDWDAVLHLLRDFLPIISIFYFLVYNVYFFYAKTIAKRKEREKQLFDRNNKIALIHSFPYKSYFMMANQHLAQVQYGHDINAKARKVSIELWHKIVLDYQQEYCEKLLSFIHLEGVAFEYAVKKYSEEHLTEFIITLQSALGELLEHLYSSVAFPLRNLMERRIFRILEDRSLDTPTKILKIFEEIKDYCICTKSIAESQIILNGRLKGISFFVENTETKERIYYEFL